MYVKIVDYREVMDQSHDVREEEGDRYPRSSSPRTLLIECDDVEYTEAYNVYPSDFGDIMLKHIGSQRYELVGRDPTLGDKRFSCVILHVIKNESGCSIPSIRRIVAPSQDVFIMNTNGKTIDSIRCSS